MSEKIVLCNKNDIEVILSWFESAVMDGYRYGAAFILPAEALVVEKLKKENHECRLEDHEIDLVLEWAEKTVSGRTGGTMMLTGYELKTWEKFH